MICIKPSISNDGAVLGDRSSGRKVQTTHNNIVRREQQSAPGNVAPSSGVPIHQACIVVASE
jgi:hypothetical protein